MSWVNFMFAGWALVPLVIASPAFAHPHVWVTAKEEVLFAPDGKFSAIRHIWTFDKHFTSYSTEGLDKNRDGKLAPEELKDLAKQNVESLVLFDYYTALKVNGVTMTFDAPRDYRMLVADGQAT